VAFCSACGTRIPDGSTTCPACSGGARATSAGTAQSSTGGLTDNVAGMLAYVTPIPAIIFLVTAPYNRSRFIRFHSFQSIFFCVAMIAIWFALFVLSVIPFLALITLPLHLIVWVGGFVLWIILLLKANQNQMFKLPVIGDKSENQADAI
jgi:uncharacterized membrane protein